uniref:GH18 domain-containing protein n=1 Tax=Anopheles epiroticus TaxID=199890 RepID=A0A182P4L2_9DIPT
MFKQLLASITLVLLLYVELSTAQGKKLACSYSPSLANSIGFQPDYIPLEVCPYVIFKSFNFPTVIGRQMLFSDNDKQAFSRLVSSVRKRSSTARVVASIDGSGRELTITSSSSVRRKALAQAVIVLLLELDADAIELNWQEPGNSHVGSGSANDRITMVQLLQDLRQAVNAASKSIQNRQRELWFRVSLHPNVIDEAYNMLDVCELVDHVTLDPNTINRSEKTHAPLLGTPDILDKPFAGLNVIPSRVGLQWIDEGCAPRKMLLGIGLHGISRVYEPSYAKTLKDKVHYLAAGTYVEQRDLCKTLNEAGWRYTWDAYGGMPYVDRMLQDGQAERISYENLDSLRLKMDMVEQKRLGGIYVDFVHSDDIYGSCGQAYSLVSYLSGRVRSIPSDIGFAIEWNRYSPAKATSLSYPPEYIPLEVCPYVIFKAFRFPTIVGRQMLFNDYDKQDFSRLVSSVRSRSNTVRVVASIDGSARDFTTTSSAIVRRKAFVPAAIALLLELDADAIELNWQEPGNSNAGKGSGNDRVTMTQLLQDLRQAVNAASKSIRSRNRELWFRGSLHPNVIEEAYNMLDVCELVDHVTLDPTTVETLENVHAPLYGTPQVLPFSVPKLGNVIHSQAGLSTNTQRWIDEGCPPRKLLLGIGLYGFKRIYQPGLVPYIINKINLIASQSTRLEQRELCNTIREAGWSYAWDSYGSMPYVTRALQGGLAELISYEDLDSLRLKMDMVEQKRFGGIYIDYIHSDDIYGYCGQPYTQTSYLFSRGKKFICSYSPSKAAPIGYLPEYLPLEMCTYVIFKAFSFPSVVDRQMLFSDSDKVSFSRVVSSGRKRSNTVRVVASIDGTARHFVTTSSSNVRRKAFVQAINTLLLELDADAIELNWKVSSNVGSDRATMVQLLQDLRQALNAASKIIPNRNRELWFRGSLHPSLIADAYNVFDVCELADHVTLDPTTAETLENAHAPLYGTPQVLPISIPNIGMIYYPMSGFNTTTQYWIDEGCAPKKLLLGIGLHGISRMYSPGLLPYVANKIYSLAPNGTELEQRELCTLIKEEGWNYAWDGYGAMSYVTRALQNGQEERISYEDMASLSLKMDMVEQKRFGGIYVDYIHSDDIYGHCGQPYSFTVYLANRLRSIPSDIGFAIEWNNNVG